MSDYLKIKVNKLFDIHPTKSYGLNNEDLYKEKGKTPVVSNSSESNGIGGYVNLDPTEKGGIITFSDTTNGADTIFYQPNDFVGYSHVQGMYPLNPELWNENKMLYFVVALKKSVGIWFDWATKFTREICGDLEVELPKKEDNTIDFDEMERVIIEVKKKYKDKTTNLLKTKAYSDPLTEKEKESLTVNPTLKTFKIGTLFRVISNPQLNKDSFNSNENSIYPYFTRTVFNNGIEGYVDYLDEDHKIKGNSISVGMLGMQFFYQPNDFYAGQFTKTIYPLFEKFNKEIALYFVTLFNKHSLKLKGLLVRDFEKEFLGTDIEVPVKEDDTIDYDYMENYIKAMSKSIAQSQIH